MALNTGKLLSATTSKKTVDLGDPTGKFTFINDGDGSVFLRQQQPGVAFVGNTAEIVALGGGELQPGEPLTVKGITWDYVCGSQTGATATVRVLPGVIGASVNATLSGVTLNSDLDKVAGTAINVNGGNRDAGTITMTLADDDPAVVDLAAMSTTIGATDDAVVTAGATGTLSAKLRAISRELGAIDADTNIIQGDTTAIKAAIELIDHLTAANSGDKDNNTQRVVIADDDILTLAIKNAAEGNGVLTEKTPTWVTLTATSDTRVPFAVDGTFATSVRVEAKLAGGDNVAEVFIRDGNVDNDDKQGHELSPNDTWELIAAPGTKFDLNDLSFDVTTSTDGIVFVYMPA